MRSIADKIESIQAALCTQFCAEIRLSEKTGSLLRIETPFLFPDGDPYQIYLSELELGGFRLSDKGHTIMQMSYENDIDIFWKGTRGNLLSQILLETGLKEDDGEFYIDSTLDEIPTNLFRLGQGITKIYDLTFLNRFRVESTFYEDLKASLYEIVDSDLIFPNYIQTGIDSAEDYPVDYMIKTNSTPLYLFGVANRDKARLTTITLERLNGYNQVFESLIVFQDFSNIPQSDAKRLMNVAGEMISSLDAKGEFKRKILKRVA